MNTFAPSTMVPCVEHAESITELYPRLLTKVLKDGERVSPRGRPTLEVSPFIFQLEDPRQCLVLQRARRLNRAYATIEKLALVAGVEDATMFCFYVDRLTEFVNPATGLFDGCYGPRVSSQLPYVYNLLRQDPDTRRAVISIYGPGDERDSLDVPCTQTLQFLLRKDALSLIVNMRSSDVYLGLPYDVNQFCFLQEVMASWLGAELGHYTHIAGSGHVYEADVEAALKITATAEDLRTSPEDPEFDLGFEETTSALKRFFDLERRFRISAALPARAALDLPSCLDPLALRLSGFCARRRARG